MEALKVKKIIIGPQGENSENYQKLKEMIRKRHIKVMMVQMGDKVLIEENLYFEILWPNPTHFILENILNNNSMVCKLHYQRFSMLFTGDIEEIAEKELLKQYHKNQQKLQATVLKVAHHGSNTSSTSEFLNAVQPRIALIGVGENNRFGHPNQEVIERLNDNGIPTYRTDQCGEITLIIDSKGKFKIKKLI